MITISTTTDTPYENHQEFLVEASGGALQVQRQLPAGTYVDVANSPLADGDSMFLCTESFPNADQSGTFIRLIPTGTVVVTFAPTRR